MWGRKRKVKFVTKHSSIAFWISIPCTFFIGSTFLITSLTLTSQHFFDHEKWALFLMSLLCGVLLLTLFRLERTRVFLHESKHALMVIVSGGKLRGFEVHRSTGQVTYEISDNHRSAGPIITLAPYCFPMLSLPVMVAALVLQDGHHLVFSLLLGFTLGIDLTMCIGEVRPAQSDFKQVQGGFLFAAMYIGGWLYCWSNFCIIWVVGGRDAIWYSGYLALRLLKRLVPELPV